MNCDFVNNLTPEQKAELRKLLDEPTQTTQPKYRVKVEFWDNGSIKHLKEYQDNQRHGKDIWWYENGQKQWEADFHQGQKHGKDFVWRENGQKWWERDYEYGKLIKEYKV